MALHLTRLHKNTTHLPKLRTGARLLHWVAKGPTEAGGGVEGHVPDDAGTEAGPHEEEGMGHLVDGRLVPAGGQQDAPLHHALQPLAVRLQGRPLLQEALELAVYCKETTPSGQPLHQ